jgi:hypothetical protein
MLDRMPVPRRAEAATKISSAKAAANGAAAKAPADGFAAEAAADRSAAEAAAGKSTATEATAGKSTAAEAVAGKSAAAEAMEATTKAPKAVGRRIGGSKRGNGRAYGKSRDVMTIEHFRSPGLFNASTSHLPVRQAGSEARSLRRPESF